VFALLFGSDHAQAAFDLLKALAAVNRFDTVVMFLSANEKSDLVALFSDLDSAKLADADVKALKCAYRVD
jgi:hypothetical protein